MLPKSWSPVLLIPYTGIGLLVTLPETLLTCVLARGPPQLWPKLAAAGHHFESVWSAACETGGSLSAFDTADPSE